MKKRIVGIILSIIILVTGTIVGAVMARMGEEQVKMSEADMERSEKIDSYIKGGNHNTDDSFETMLLALDATIENPIEYNDIVYNYEYLKTVHGLNDEQLNYISSLIIDGCEAMDILEICYFWLDTNEDIKVIEKIYRLKDRYKGSNWIEGAFNEVTGDKCGVLDEKGVAEYLNQGLSVEDISVANKLCRKGVLTIQEILDMRINGTGFAEIVTVVDGISSAEVPSEAMTASYVLSAEADADKREIISAQDVMYAKTLSEISGESFGKYIEKSIDGQALEEIIEEVESEYDRNISDDLRSRGILKTVTKEDREMYRRRYEEEEQYE